MEVAIDRRPDGAHVRPSGELDLASSAELYRSLAALRAEGVRRIHLDLSRLNFIDSAGLVALLRWKDEAKARADQFSVLGAQGLVRRVLRDTGTHDVLGS